MTTTNQKPALKNVICIDRGRLRFADIQRRAAPKSRMDWSGWRTMAIALSLQNCAYCWGLGFKHSANEQHVVCSCVFRNIFRVCLERFQFCLQGDSLGKTSMVGFAENRCGGQPMSWGLKNEEFIADFELVAFRTLNYGLTKEQLTAEQRPTTLEWQVFVMHMLHGQPWGKCCARLNMDRGNFYHQVYRIQTVLGGAFAETYPHALFPIDEYFSPITKKSPKFGTVTEMTPKQRPHKRYVRKAA
jgi:hypothetical protein